MIETMVEITDKFRERSLLVPQYIADEEVKKKRCHEMLWDNIWEFVSLKICKTLDYMITKAREQEIELQCRIKCVPNQVSDHSREGEEAQYSGFTFGRPSGSGPLC